jgi:hypothetical protein
MLIQLVLILRYMEYAKMLIWEIAGFKASGDKKNSYPFKNWDVGNFPLHISRWVKLTQFYIKVLSSEMDQAKREREAQRFSENFAHPHPGIALQSFRTPPYSLIGNLKPTGLAAMKIQCRTAFRAFYLISMPDFVRTLMYIYTIKQACQYLYALCICVQCTA